MSNGRAFKKGVLDTKRLALFISVKGKFLIQENETLLGTALYKKLVTA